MKKTWLLIIIPAILCLVSCEKESEETLSSLTKNYNSKFEQTGEPYDYVIANPVWELIDAKHIDEFGNIGELYFNKNNPIETFFSIKEQSKACGEYQGIWETLDYYDEATQSTISVKTCRKTNTNQNCGVLICADKNNKVVSVSMWSLDRQ